MNDEDNNVSKTSVPSHKIIFYVSIQTSVVDVSIFVQTSYEIMYKQRKLVFIAPNMALTFLFILFFCRLSARAMLNQQSITPVGSNRYIRENYVRGCNVESLTPGLAGVTFRHFAAHKIRRPIYFNTVHVRFLPRRGTDVSIIGTTGITQKDPGLTQKRGKLTRGYVAPTIRNAVCYTPCSGTYLEWLSRCFHCYTSGRQVYCLFDPPSGRQTDCVLI